jgi:hypothetical protein
MAAHRVGGVFRDPADAQRHGVDHRHVTADPSQQHRMVGCDAVEVVARGCDAVGHLRVVPSPADDPLARSGRPDRIRDGRADALRGADDLGSAVDLQQVAAVDRRVRVALDEPGEKRPAREVDDLGVVADQRPDGRVVADRRDDSAGHCDGRGPLGPGGLALVHRQHAAAEKHRVRLARDLHLPPTFVEVFSLGHGVAGASAYILGHDH